MGAILLRRRCGLIYGTISGQNIKIADTVTAAETNNTLTAKFTFSKEWERLKKIAYFRKSGEESFPFILENDCIPARAGLNLSEGEWEISIRGYDLRNGSETENTAPRLTTGIAALHVWGTVSPGENEFPEIPKSLAEQILAAAEDAKETAADVERRANAGEFDGEKGEKGDPGTYELTDEDKKEIADDVRNELNIPTEQTVADWGFTKNTGTYDKPSGGIPESDLSENVRAKLNDRGGSDVTKETVKAWGFTEGADLAAVATSGNYDDLANKPTIPDVSGLYTKPVDGIPESDLSDEVKAKLNEGSGGGVSVAIQPDEPDPTQYKIWVDTDDDEGNAVPTRFDFDNGIYGYHDSGNGWDVIVANNIFHASQTKSFEKMGKTADEMGGNSITCCLVPGVAADIETLEIAGSVSEGNGYITNTVPDGHWIKFDAVFPTAARATPSSLARIIVSGQRAKYPTQTKAPWAQYQNVVYKTIHDYMRSREGYTDSASTQYYVPPSIVHSVCYDYGANWTHKDDDKNIVNNVRYKKKVEFLPEFGIDPSELSDDEISSIDLSTINHNIVYLENSGGWSWYRVMTRMECDTFVLMCMCGIPYNKLPSSFRDATGDFVYRTYDGRTTATLLNYYHAPKITIKSGNDEVTKLGGVYWSFFDPFAPKATKGDKTYSDTLKQAEYDVYWSASQTSRSTKNDDPLAVNGASKNKFYEIKLRAKDGATRRVTSAAMLAWYFWDTGKVFKPSVVNTDTIATGDIVFFREVRADKDSQQFDAVVHTGILTVEDLGNGDEIIFNHVGGSIDLDGSADTNELGVAAETINGVSYPETPPIVKECTMRRTRLAKYIEAKGYHESQYFFARPYTVVNGEVS